MLAIIGLAIGVAAALLTNVHIPPQYSTYMAIGILAALDSVFGGITANMQKKFNLKIFISGFFTNAILASLLTFMGNLLDVDLYLAIIVVFGTRLFQNFAFIRRFILNKYIKGDNI